MNTSSGGEESHLSLTEHGVRKSKLIKEGGNVKNHHRMVELRMFSNGWHLG